MCTNNYADIERFDKVIAKIKWCSSVASQCISRITVGISLHDLDFDNDLDTES